jgi:hypothetical protein
MHQFAMRFPADFPTNDPSARLPVPFSLLPCPGSVISEIPSPSFAHYFRSLAHNPTMPAKQPSARLSLSHSFKVPLLKPPIVKNQ